MSAGLRARPSGARRSADSRLVGAISAWFERGARDLPWRREDPKTGRRDPYRSLVSEVMLQQTQVSRVVQKFNEFVALFPDVRTLARADEHDVLAAWTGLGYYRRARSLHAAAKMIVERFGGKVPQRAEELVELPGVGRYTAGAIASMVFGKAEAIVDGNVVRVLFRIHGKDLASDDAAGMAWAWERAEELVKLGEPALFNEGMMELGATVCTPASPRCGVCPVRRECVAKREGCEARIPRAKTAARQREQWHACVVVRDARGRLLLERREGTSLWKGLWQAPTVESDSPCKGSVAARLGLVVGKSRRGAPAFRFKTSACLVHFRVQEARAAGRAAAKAGRRWFDENEARTLPMSSPMRRILGFEGER